MNIEELKKAAEAATIDGMYEPCKWGKRCPPSLALKLIAVYEIANGLKDSAMSTTFEQLRAALKEDEK